MPTPTEKQIEIVCRLNSTYQNLRMIGPEEGNKLWEKIRDEAYEEKISLNLIQCDADVFELLIKREELLGSYFTI